MSPFSKFSDALASEELGVVFGWAIVCKIDGREYVDTQGDVIPERTMLKAATQFMRSGRVLKAMHEGEAIGEVLFAFPVTDEICKALDIASRKSGLLIGVRPRPSSFALDKVRDGRLRGFSIAGSIHQAEEFP